MEVNPVQLEKALSCISTTLSGIVLHTKGNNIQQQYEVKQPTMKMTYNYYVFFFTKIKNRGIINMLHKLNIRISGIFVFMGILYPFLTIIILNLVKTQALLNGYGYALILI